MNALFSPKAQLYVAWIIFFGCLIGWPWSQLTWASEEPPAILALSWIALMIGAWNTIITAQVNKTTVEADNADIEHAEKVEVNGAS